MKDTTLASNVFTAYVPRPDLAIGHGAKYLGQHLRAWGSSAAQALLALARRQPTCTAPGPAAMPGDILRMTTARSDAPEVMATLRCAETGRAHPILPLSAHEMVHDHWAAIAASQKPGKHLGFFQEPDRCRGLRDAFLQTAQVAVPQGAQGDLRVREARPVLPPEVLGSNLLNRGLVMPGSGDAATPGVVQRDAPNTLYDPKTGFVAGITIRDTVQPDGAPVHEVLIAFAPTTGQGGAWGTLQQGARAFLNILGLSPCKNFAQAAKLTALVKQHLETLNQQLPEGAPRYRLKLTGHSLGGGLATYAALRHEVPALTVGALRLGLLTRAAVGLEAMRRAPQLVEEVVVSGDWVADNALARPLGLLGGSAGAIGSRFIVPRPTREQIITLASAARIKDGDALADAFSIHNDFNVALRVQEMAERVPQAPATSRDAWS